MTYNSIELLEMIGKPVLSQNLLTGEVTHYNISKDKEPSSDFADVYKPVPESPKPF